MSELSAVSSTPKFDSDEVSIFGLVTVVLRWRRLLVALSLVGALVGIAAGLLSKRVYVSHATFLPQDSEGATSDLALAASRLGINVPNSSPTWGPQVYVELLRSQALLEPIVADTVRVVEEGNRRLGVVDLVGGKGSTNASRLENAVARFRTIVSVTEDKKLGAVKVAVSTPWPSVSLALATRLLSDANAFNLDTRKSQAAAEREFVEKQSAAAESALRAAEDQLQYFLQRNRNIEPSGERAFERDRLQRELELRQQVYSTLVQSREEARIREVRNTPVFVVLESPRLPALPQSRKVVLKTILGAILGAAFGLAIAFLAEALSTAKKAPTQQTAEFFEVVREVTPRFLRRAP